MELINLTLYVLFDTFYFLKLIDLSRYNSKNNIVQHKIDTFLKIGSLNLFMFSVLFGLLVLINIEILCTIFYVYIIYLNISFIYIINKFNKIKK